MKILEIYLQIIRLLNKCLIYRKEKLLLDVSKLKPVPKPASAMESKLLLLLLSIL
jgi:hypothetical protein